LSLFIYAIESPESKKLYLLRLKQFFDFHGLSGSLEKQAEAFFLKAKENDGAQWVQDAILALSVTINKESNAKRLPLALSITTTTLSNYSVK
jgi:hypothetical protein